MKYLVIFMISTVFACSVLKKQKVESSEDSTQQLAPSDSVVQESSTDISDSNFCVLSGVFTVGSDNKVPEDGSITVRQDGNDSLIGIYYPNLTTGKYLFILQVGKAYKITFEEEGYVLKTVPLIVPKSTDYRKIYQKINLGVLSD